MYYVMTCLSPAQGYLATLDYDDSADPDFLRSWMSGDRFDVPPPTPLVLTRETAPDTVLAELWQSPVTLMSKRLHAALLAAGVSNLDIYPAEIHDPAQGLVHDDYVAFNLIGRIAAADSLRRHDDVLISAPEISSARVDGALMFRLAEAVNTIVVHDSVKQAIEAAGIDTLTFIDPADWTG